MEKQLNSKITVYFKDFKDIIADKLKGTNLSDEHMSNTLKLIYDYPHMIFKKEDFPKAETN